jgi:hypothetical protein
MAPSNERLSAAGYTRESVDIYLGEVAAERSRIERAMAEARARTELANRRAEWLEADTKPSSPTTVVDPADGWQEDETETEGTALLAGFPSIERP